MVKGLVARRFGVLLPLLFLLSCGIETYYYLPFVPAVTGSSITSATINLPSVPMAYFRNFSLYYRIYVSGSNISISSYTHDILRAINPTLDLDYYALLPYTDTTTASTANAAVVMGNRGYQPLFFNTSGGISSDELTTSTGEQVVISFPPAAGSIPTLNRSSGGLSYELMRSNVGGITPTPDRYFRYTGSGYYDTISTTTNADVVDDTTGGSTKDYAYAAIYIVTTGLNEQTYAPLYSIPTFVGIFELP
jgi:hypothetical protein